MRILTGLVILAALGATEASAQPAKVADMTYVQGARCAGLASSSKLGATDVKERTAWLKAQAWGRDSYIQDKADEAKSDAKREADRAGEYAKPKLLAELTGSCATLKN